MMNSAYAKTMEMAFCIVFCGRVHQGRLPLKGLNPVLLGQCGKFVLRGGYLRRAILMLSINYY
jgi:hypothetical protein